MNDDSDLDSPSSSMISIQLSGEVLSPQSPNSGMLFATESDQQLVSDRLNLQIEAFLIEQTKLLGAPFTSREIREWVSATGVGLVERAAETKQMSTPAMAWSNAKIRAHVFKVWVADNLQDGLRSETMVESARVKLIRYDPDADPLRAIVKPRTPWHKALTRSCLKRFPIVRWVPRLTWRKVRSDVLSGLSTGVNIVPKGVAFAFLAGLPPAVGLYSACFPTLTYMIFGTSRHLGVAPSAIVSLLTRAVVSGWCEDDNYVPRSDDVTKDYWIGNCDATQYQIFVNKLAFIAGVLLFMVGVLRGGWLLRFFSRPLMSGFLSAAAVIICLSQLRYALYNHSVHIESDPSAWIMLRDLCRNLGHTHYPTLLFSIGVVVLIVLLHKWKRTKESYSILVVSFCILLSYTITKAYGAQSVVWDLTGSMSANLPKPILSTFFSDINFEFVQLGAAVALVGILEHMSAAQIFALRHSYQVDASQEMLAAGVANMVGGIFSCMPVMGAVSQSAMLAAFGGQTALANGISGLAVLFTIMLASLVSKVLYYLPKSTLALIIMSAVVGLVDFKEIKFLYKAHRRDLWIVISLLVTTLAVGIHQGLLVAILVNGASHVYRSGNTESFEEGRVPGTDIFQSALAGEPLYIYTDLTVLGFNGPLFFGNADRFKGLVMSYLSVDRRKKGVILDASRISFIDATGVHTLEEVARAFDGQGVVLLYANFNRKVLLKLDACFLRDKIGITHFFETIPAAIDQLLRPDGDFESFCSDLPRPEHSHRLTGNELDTIPPGRGGDGHKSWLGQLSLWKKNRHNENQPLLNQQNQQNQQDQQNQQNQQVSHSEPSSSTAPAAPSSLPDSAIELDSQTSKDRQIQ